MEEAIWKWGRITVSNNEYIWVFFSPIFLKCYEILHLPWGNPIYSFLVFSHLPRSQNDSSQLSIRAPDLCISCYNSVVFPLFQSLLYYFHKIQFYLYFWEAENSDPGASSKVLEDSERFIGTYLYPRDVTSRLFLTAGMQHSSFLFPRRYSYGQDQQVLHNKVLIHECLLGLIALIVIVMT